MTSPSSTIASSHREPAPRRSPRARPDVPVQARAGPPRPGAGAGRAPRSAAGRAAGSTPGHPRPPPRAGAPCPAGCPTACSRPTRTRRSAAPGDAGPPRAATTADWRRRAAPRPRPAPPVPRARHRPAASPRAARPRRPRPVAPRRCSSSSPTRDAGSSPSSASRGSSSPNTMPPSAVSSAAAPIGSIPGAAVPPPLGLAQQPGQLLRPVLELGDDLADALVVRLEPPGEQLQRPGLGDARQPADGRRQLAHAERRGRVRRLGRQEPLVDRPARRQPAGHGRLAGGVELAGEAQGEVGDRALPAVAERRDAHARRWPADPAAPSPTRHRRSRPASGARPGPARTPRASRGRRRRSGG